MNTAEEMSGDDLLKQGIEAFKSGEQPPEQPETEEVQEQLDLQPETNQEVEQPQDEDAHGYMTKEEWTAKGNDPDDYLTEDEFKEVGDKRDSDATRTQLAKESVMMRSQMEELLKNQAAMMERVEREAYEKAKAEIEGRLAEAKDIGDVDAALDAQAELSKLDNDQKKEDKKEELTPQQAHENQFIEKWQGENSSWFGKHQEASQMMSWLLQQEADKGTPIEQGFENAMNQVASKFDYLFPNRKPKQERRPSQVTETTRGAKTSANKVYRLSDIPVEQQAAVKRMAKIAKMDVSDYIKQTLEG